MRWIDLVSNIVKILGMYYSYNDKLEIQENFKRHVKKIEKNLQIWRIKDLSIAGKITVFKNRTTGIIENNSKFNCTRIKQNSKRFFMENSQS